MTPLVVDPSGYLKPHHSVGHCLAPLEQSCELRNGRGGQPG